MENSVGVLKILRIRRSDHGSTHAAPVAEVRVDGGESREGGAKN